jgi:hypothetical protein
MQTTMRGSWFPDAQDSPTLLVFLMCFVDVNGSRKTHPPNLTIHLQQERRDQEQSSQAVHWIKQRKLS